MQPLFIGLSMTNILLLAAVFVSGTVPAGSLIPGRFHVPLAIFTGLFGVLAHMISFTYFMATTRWLMAATEKQDLDRRRFVVRPAHAKRRALWLCMLAVTATMLALFSGAAAAAPSAAAARLVHPVAAVAAVAANLVALLGLFGLVRARAGLMDEALTLVNSAPKTSSAGRTTLVPAHLPVLAGCLCVLGGAFATPARADDNAPPAAAPLAASPPAASQPAPSAEVVRWLERIEAKHKQIRTLRGAVKYDRNQLELGDSQRRFGTLVYAAGPPPKFAVHFDRVVINKYLRQQDRWYIFDGVYMVERLHDRKQFFRHRLSPPGSDPKAGKALGIGQGPLFVPLPVRKDDLLGRYDIQLVPPAEDDPPGVATVHLRLVPLAPSQTSFTILDLWHDRESLLPVKARSVDRSNNESIVWLETQKATVNGPIDDKVVDTTLPTELDWQVEDIPFQGRPVQATGSPASRPASRPATPAIPRIRPLTDKLEKPDER